MRSAAGGSLVLKRADELEEAHCRVDFPHDNTGII